MKRYQEREGLREAPARQTQSGPRKEVVAESDFAKAAYAWNNALKLAAEKMWGERLGIPQKLTMS